MTDMDAEDVRARRKRLTRNGARGPFKQMGEPVINPASRKPERQKGFMIPYGAFLHRNRAGFRASFGS